MKKNQNLTFIGGECKPNDVNDVQQAIDQRNMLYCNALDMPFNFGGGVSRDSCNIPYNYISKMAMAPLFGN